MSNKMNFNRPGNGKPIPPGTRQQAPGPQQFQLNVNVNTLENFVCEQCGSDRFSQTVLVKRLPPLQSPTGKEAVIFQPAGIMCAVCGVHDNAIPRSDWDALIAAQKEQQERLEAQDESADATERDLG